MKTQTEDKAVIEYHLVFNGEFNQAIDWDKFQYDFNFGSFYAATKKHAKDNQQEYHQHCDNLKFLKDEDSIAVRMVDSTPGKTSREFVLQNKNANTIVNIDETPYTVILNEILLATGNKISMVEVKRERLVEDSYEVGSNILSMGATTMRMAH